MTGAPDERELSLRRRLTEAEQGLLMSRLWSLLAWQTERYTMGDSSSVTVETAQELLASLRYTLDLAMDEAHMPCGRLLTDELRPLLARGQELLRARLNYTKRLWATVCRTAPAPGNVYYTDTLRGIGEYLNRYDLYFFAHHRPASIDYPLLVSAPEALQGITYAERYLRHMLTENLLLRRFEGERLERVLRAATPDYQETYLNLCEQPLTNALGLSLIGKPGGALTLGDADRRQLKAALRGKDREALRRLLRLAADALCGELDIADEQTREYLARFADSLPPRLEAASAAGSLARIFIG